MPGTLKELPNPNSEFTLYKQGQKVVDGLWAEMYQRDFSAKFKPGQQEAAKLFGRMALDEIVRPIIDARVQAPNPFCLPPVDFKPEDFSEVRLSVADIIDTATDQAELIKSARDNNWRDDNGQRYPEDKILSMQKKLDLAITLV